MVIFSESGTRHARVSAEQSVMCHVVILLQRDSVTSFPATGKNEPFSLFKTHFHALLGIHRKVFWVFGYCDLFKTQKSYSKQSKLSQSFTITIRRKHFSSHKNNNHGEKNGSVIHYCFFPRIISRNTQRISEGLKEVIKMKMT